MKGFSTPMYGSLAPNSTKLARFWSDLATSFSVLTATSDGVSENAKYKIGINLQDGKSNFSVNTPISMPMMKKI
jgi:hypothetical protein